MFKIVLKTCSILLLSVSGGFGMDGDSSFPAEYSAAGRRGIPGITQLILYRRGAPRILTVQYYLEIGSTDGFFRIEAEGEPAVLYKNENPKRHMSFVAAFSGYFLDVDKFDGIRMHKVVTYYNLKYGVPAVSEDESVPAETG